MRKFTLMLAFLAFAGMTFAQKAACDLNAGGKIDDAVAKHQPKAFGDVIWSEDFDGAKWSGTVKVDGMGYLLDPDVALPEGWVITDGNELNYFWHWSDVGPRGSYVTPASVGTWDTPYNGLLTTLANYGASTSNGVMMLESNYFNNTPTGGLSSNYLDMDATLEYGPIDMSNAPGAIFNVKTMYRTCCASTAQVGVSIGIGDGAGNITWSDEIALNVLTPNNSHTYAVERDMHVNVSRVKAGSDFLVTAGASEVYFRLHKSDAAFYYWFVDDITFYEPPTNDLIVEDTWFDYMYDATNPDFGQSSTASYNFWGGYTQIPQSVVAPFIQFRAAVNNNGTADATNAKVNVLIEKDGAEVYTVASTPKTVAKFFRDTLMAAADFSPVDKGFYQVSMTVAMDADDEAYFNNAAGYDFNVVHDTYSRVTMGGEADFSTAGPSDWASGAFDGDVVAQPYDFPASATEVGLKALQVYFALPYSADDEAAIIAGDFAMYARVYKIDEAGDIVDAGIASDLYTVQISDTNTWVTLDFLDEGNLVVPGGQTYYVGIETYTGFTPTSSARRRFEIGSDIYGPKQPVSGGLVYLSSLGGWYSTGDNYAINLVLNMQGATALPLDFETPVVINSWSSTTTIIDNPQSGGINTSAKVAEHIKDAGNAWAGCKITLDNAIDFSTTKTFSMKVFSPAAKTPILFKLEVAGGAVKEVWEKTTKANEWETITWNFDGTTSGVFKDIVLFFNAGVDGAGTYLFDDIYLNESVNVTFNVDMSQPIADPTFFVAGTDKVYVTGSFANGAGETWGWDEPGTGESILLSDADGDKIYTATVAMLKNVGEIQYKYFKNTTWAGGEWTGDPNRIITIGATNYVVDPADIWVHEVGVNDMNLDAITLAPNPFKAELVINNVNGASQIVVSNVLGQAVMTVNEIANRVVLSTEGLNKGIYFVTIIDQNNNRRTERVVKQ